MNAHAIRYDWTLAEVEAVLALPFYELVDRARQVHRTHHDPGEVQLATLSNIKKGGCPEDCGYCPQAARYHTGVKGEPLLDLEVVREQANRAKAAGATRFCMGAAWRSVRDGPAFDRVVEMVRVVSDLNMEACVTLGMLKPHQIARLRDAGLTAYNHNLDTSREHYGEVITTRDYDDRLQTLQNVRDAGVQVCCGGIIGLGESTGDRAALLHTLATMQPHPESVPINKLVQAPGTPLEGAQEVDVFDWLRVIAAARILMPQAKVRLAAGRSSLSREGRALALLCGANSIFYGEELLTTPNPSSDEDAELLAVLGMRPMAAQVRPDA